MPRGLRQNITSAILYATVALLAAGAVYAAALLFPIVVSDTLLLTDETAIRTSAMDRTDPQSDAYNNNRITSEEFEISDSASIWATTIEDLGLSDSAQAITSSFHEVSVSSVVGVMDSASTGASISDNIEIQEKRSLSTTVIDGMSLLDSIGRSFLILISDAFAVADIPDVDEAQEEESVEEREDRNNGGNGGPRRVVYDSSYFATRPLSRMQISGIDITDGEGMTLNQLRSGTELVISVTARNFQNTDQHYVMYVQITDESGVAVSIIQVTGSMEDGEQGMIEGEWKGLSGSYLARAFLTEHNAHPGVISETFSITLHLQD